MAGGESGDRESRPTAEAGGGAARRNARKRTPRKNVGSDSSSKAKKDEAEAASGGKPGAADAAGSKGRKGSRPTRESPSRQNGGEEEPRPRAEPEQPTPEKADRTDSKSKRTPRKRIVRTSTDGTPSAGTPSASPAKTPTSTPTKQNASGGASAGATGAGGRHSPTPGSAGGEGRREVVKIHFPTAQERQAGGSPKLDASKFVEVEQSPPTTPPAAASTRGAAEEPPLQKQHPRVASNLGGHPEAVNHRQPRGQPEPSSLAASSSRGGDRAGQSRGSRAATVVTVGSHGTTMADVAVQPSKARVQEPRVPMGHDEYPDGQSPPRSLIRKVVPQLNTAAAAADGRATSPTPPGMTGWTPPSPHSRKPLGASLLGDSGSEGEEDVADRAVVARPAAVATFPARPPMPSSAGGRSAGAGAADAADERGSAGSTKGPESRPQEASAGQHPQYQTATQMQHGMYPEYGYGVGPAFAQYPPSGCVSYKPSRFLLACLTSAGCVCRWYGGMHMAHMPPQQAMAAAYGVYGMPQMQQMHGQQQMGGQQMHAAYGALPPEWWAAQEMAAAGQWPMGGMPPGMPGTGQHWAVGPDGYSMVMPPQQHPQLSSEAALSQLNGELGRAQQEQSAESGDDLDESPEETQPQQQQENEDQEPDKQQAEHQHPEEQQALAPVPAPAPARRPTYVRPSDRGKPGFLQEQEHKLLAYAAGGDEQKARALALKVARHEEEAAAKQAAAAGGAIANPTEDGGENAERISTKSKRRSKRRVKKGGDGDASDSTNANGGDASTRSINTVRSGPNAPVSSAPPSSADDDIGGLEWRGGQQRDNGSSVAGRGNPAQNYDDDDIGGLEYASAQRRLHGGPRQVRGAVFASDVEQTVQHGQQEQDTTPQVAQLFAQAAATGAWGKPS